MVVPFGSALERRSRTTSLSPDRDPGGSTHVDTAFTGTTSSISRTASGNVAVVALVRQRVFAESPWHPASREARCTGAVVSHEHRTRRTAAPPKLVYMCCRFS
ncbi:hypothetical protein DN402_34175 [Streptomyces sp. SW4]|nr:hypothetical protein DN402_34175 [Streptomyces sp. SW4]